MHKQHVSTYTTHTTMQYVWKGCCMGVADVIPGVSGSTIALLLGIYDRFIQGLKQLNVLFIWYALLLLYDKKYANQYQYHVRRIDWRFFIPLGIGMITGVASIVFLFSLIEHKTWVYALFLGLIVVSTTIFAHTHSVHQHLTWLFVGILLGLMILTLPIFMMQSTILAGFLGFGAMLIPGISGAYVLIIIGMYEPIMYALRHMVWWTLIPFIIGGIVAISVVPKLMHMLLPQHSKQVYACCVGIIIGSLYVLMEASLLFTSAPHAIISFGVLGVGVLLWLVR
ncbi:MAG: DUF368 domain-containing protein [Candidatus Woesearchaeota archaeon]